MDEVNWIDCGFVKVNRALQYWGWYKEINTKVLFIHMLIKANWKDEKFRGTTVPRGSFVSSISKLAEETGLTNDEVRTAISHLLKTNEITKQSTNKFTVFTVVNYSLYQNNPEQEQSQDTGNAQTIPKPFPIIKEYKKGIREESNSTICPEPENSAPNPSGIQLILNDKTFYDVPMDKLALWREAYPAVDLEHELQKMRAWLDANPTKRKTRRGIERFINNWLTRTQDSGRGSAKGGDRTYAAEENGRSFAL